MLVITMQDRPSTAHDDPTDFLIRTTKQNRHR